LRPHTPPPPDPTPSPYTTLFRSQHVRFEPDLAGGRDDYDPWANRRDYSLLSQPHERGRRYTVHLPERLAAATTYRVTVPQPDARSEEHTSELQSRENLVCRLLLE